MVALFPNLESWIRCWLEYVGFDRLNSAHLAWMCPVGRG
jgi:hypothetical protein